MSTATSLCKKVCTTAAFRFELKEQVNVGGLFKYSPSPTQHFVYYLHVIQY